MAETVALADRVVTAATIVGATEIVAGPGPTVPVGATVRIVDRAAYGATGVGRMTEHVASTDRKIPAAAGGSTELGTRLRPAATVGAAVGIAGRADAPAAAVRGIQDALSPDTLLARWAGVRGIAGVRTGPARSEAGGDHVAAAPFAEPPLVEGRRAAIAEGPAHGLALPHHLPRMRPAVGAASQERGVAVERVGPHRRSSNQEPREDENVGEGRHPSRVRVVGHLETDCMQRLCTTLADGSGHRVMHGVRLAPDAGSPRTHDLDAAQALPVEPGASSTVGRHATTRGVSRHSAHSALNH
jgi:hypothetical protein